MIGQTKDGSAKSHGNGKTKNGNGKPRLWARQSNQSSFVKINAKYITKLAFLNKKTSPLRNVTAHPGYLSVQAEYSWCKALRHADVVQSSDHDQALMNKKNACLICIPWWGGLMVHQL